MFRKIALATAAIATIGAAALAPTSASAYWRGGFARGGFYGHSHFYGGPRVVVGGPVYAYGGCIRTRWVPTPWGPQLRRVNVCY